MRERLHLMGEGYAADLRDKIEKGASALTYLNPYDYTILKQKYPYLTGIELVEEEADIFTFRIELLVSHPQGVGSSFDTRIIVDASIPTGRPRFSSSYPDEEILWYQLFDLGEEGVLLSEEGEMLVC
jgi:hypothetical protein